MNNENAVKRFQEIVNQQVSVPQREWDFLIPNLMQRSFKKHEYLASDGDVIRNFYFIISGLVRFYYSTEEGKEFNKHFAMEDQFAGSFHSLVLQQPCGFYIQAIEPTDTLVLPNKLLNELYLRHACWERLGRKNAENLLLIKEAREKEMLLDSLEIRYVRFIEMFPGIADRLPQYHIASFLGVTNVALSRIRKKINLG